jgi:hypothetical protein
LEHTLKIRFIQDFSLFRIRFGHFHCIKEINFFFKGALTKGDRRAATGVDLGEFNFDTTYGRNSLRLMYQHICIVSNTGIPLNIIE